MAGAGTFSLAWDAGDVIRITDYFAIVVNTVSVLASFVYIVLTALVAAFRPQLRMFAYFRVFCPASSRVLCCDFGSETNCSTLLMLVLLTLLTERLVVFGLLHPIKNSHVGACRERLCGCQLFRYGRVPVH